MAISDAQARQLWISVFGTVYGQLTAHHSTGGWAVTDFDSAQYSLQAADQASQAVRILCDPTQVPAVVIPLPPYIGRTGGSG